MSPILMAARVGTEADDRVSRRCWVGGVVGVVQCHCGTISKGAVEWKVSRRVMSQ